MQVNKIEIQYDKTSKQVDVQALKETLWVSLQETHKLSQVSFFSVLAANVQEFEALISNLLIYGNPYELNGFEAYIIDLTLFFFSILPFSLSMLSKMFSMASLQITNCIRI